MTVEDVDHAVEKCLEKKKGINMGIGKQFFYRSLYAVQLHNCFKVCCDPISHVMLPHVSLSTIPSHTMSHMHATQYIDRSRFILVSSERLQSHPSETLREIVSFIGLREQFSLDQLSAVGRIQPGKQDLPLYPAKHTVDPVAIEFKFDEAAAGTRVVGSGDAGMQQFIGTAVGKYFPSFESNSGWKLKSEYDAISPSLANELQQFFAPYNELLFRLLGTRQFEDEWRGVAAPYN